LQPRDGMCGQRASKRTGEPERRRSAPGGRRLPEPARFRAAYGSLRSGRWGSSGRRCGQGDGKASAMSGTFISRAILHRRVGRAVTGSNRPGGSTLMRPPEQCWGSRRPVTAAGLPWLSRQTTVDHATVSEYTLSATGR